MVLPSAPPLAPEPAGVFPEIPKPSPAGGSASVRAAVLARLKAGIRALEEAPARLEEGPVKTQAGPWTLGLRDLDDRLPAAGLAVNGVHGVVPASVADIGPATGFAAALAVRRIVTLGDDERPVLWVRQSEQVREAGRLHGRGLAQLGLPHTRLAYVSLRKIQSVFWTVEEALKSGALAAVVSDVEPSRLDLAVVRRLILAADAGSTPAILVAPRPQIDAVAGAHTRWQIRALPSLPPPHDPDAPGKATWAVDLQRCRGGRPGECPAEWDHATYRFSVAPAVSDRAAEAGAPQGRRSAAAR